MIRRPPRSTRTDPLFPYTTLFRSHLEYCDGVYDGALPFMGGGNVEPHGTTSRVRSEQPVHFGSMFNVQRLLEGEKLDRVIDAMQPGGSGQPFEGLTSHEREELAALYRLGYPRGDEFMIAKPMGQIWLWSSIAEKIGRASCRERVCQYV